MHAPEEKHARREEHRELDELPWTHPGDNSRKPARGQGRHGTRNGRLTASLGLLLLLLGLSPLSAASAASGNPDLAEFLSQLRIRFYGSVESAAITEETLAAIEKAFRSPQDSWPPVIRAYYAALEGLRGKHASRLFDKAGHVLKAISLMRNLPEANPGSIEIRFLRFSFFSQVPPFFGVRSTVAPDLATLIRMLEEGSDDDVPRDIERDIVAYLLDCGQADRQQLSRLQRLRGLLEAARISYAEKIRSSAKKTSWTPSATDGRGERTLTFRHA